MLYRRRKRRSFFRYSSFYRKPLPLGRRILRFLIILLVVLTAISVIVLVQLKPYFYKAAKTRVTDVVLIQVNDVIEAEMLQGAFDYDKLVTLLKDNEGNITALTTNTVMINTLQTKISNGVFKMVSDEVITDLDIPIGNAVGGVLFTGQGPSFRVRILTVADVETKLSHDVEPVGINQSRFRLYMDITVAVDILIPGFSTETIYISNQTAIYETTIFGQVPNVYADMGTLGGKS